MTVRHAMLGVLVAAIWGLNFIAARVALNHVAPLLLVALRFGVAAIPALFLPRPAVAWPRMIALALTLFIGQFTFLFWGLQAGMPAGLASAVTQAQALITAALAGVVLHESLTPRTWVGLAVATCGLILIGVTVGTAGVTVAGLVLTLLAAASWAVGNVLMRGIGKVDRFALVVWLSVVPPVPLLLLSLLVEGPAAIHDALNGTLWITLSAVLYMALVATVGGYGIWGYLLRHYPAGTVAPFALLVPAFGLAVARLVLGEQSGPTRLAGVALIVAGLVIFVLPLPRWSRLTGKLRTG